MNAAATIKDRDALVDSLEEEAEFLASKGQHEQADQIHMAVLSIKQAVAEALDISARAEAARDAANAVWIDDWSRQVLGLPLSTLSGGR